ADFTLETSAPVVLALYDMNGRKVKEAVNATLAAGSHSARIPLSGLAAGSYMLRLTTSDHSVSRAVSVMR
ncbi:MAG: T9SS type A sorting domain-containing protein, partial [Bacteroidetes bacterium]|nr:T9SS type A sorting domain-containing protein [Bacteroidota bacterium]